MSEFSYTEISELLTWKKFTSLKPVKQIKST